MTQVNTTIIPYMNSFKKWQASLLKLLLFKPWNYYSDPDCKRVESSSYKRTPNLALLAMINKAEEGNFFSPFLLPFTPVAVSYCWKNRSSNLTLKMLSSFECRKICDRRAENCKNCTLLRLIAINPKNCSCCVIWMRIFCSCLQSGVATLVSLDLLRVDAGKEMPLNKEEFKKSL